MKENVYLSAYLAPLAPWLSRSDVTDVLINRPGEVWVETSGGGVCREPADQLNEMALQMANGQLYSMTTFPDLNKTEDMQITFNWRLNFI